MLSLDPSQVTNNAQAVTRHRFQPGSGWLMLASLLWLPQAAAIAWAVQCFADGRALAHLPVQVGMVAVCGILRALCEGLGIRVTYVHARAHVSHLRRQALQAQAQTSALDRSRPASGLVAGALAEQAEAIVPWLARYQPAMWRVMVVAPVIALAVATQSWLAALILLFAAPLIPLFMAIVGWRAKAASEAHMVELGQMNGFLLDRLRGLSTLRALHAVPLTASRLRDHARSLCERTMRVLRIAFLSSAVLELFAALGVAMVAMYVGFHLLGNLPFGAWGDKLSLGQALWVLMLAPSFFDPLRELSAVWHDRAAGQAAMESLQALHRQQLPLPAALENVPRQAANDAVEVEVRGLEVAVQGHSALPPVSLKIAAGEHVAIWAPSGAGKSVLLAQLAGLLPVPAHTLWMDGLPMDDAHWPSMRARTAWMGQQAHVFAATVSHNVSLGRETVDAAGVRDALAKAGLMQSLGQRPSSSLGEGGQGLSGGEAVRLALARMAVHQHAGLWLVDEPTAHLDPETAKQVMHNLRYMAEGKTLVVATHDRALAALMDRSICLPQAGELS
ncbi:thiol reductant ABC exporter subunit CydD [Comamonas halotolerans]|uniref:thiol reductant ABC exporter subunit CydD n=1 Tax=Comamonas halotolerans TaxID=3041496 RepID=UPI0039B75B36